MQMIRQDRKQIALLIDPENTFHKKDIEDIILASKESRLDYFFVGGSYTLKIFYYVMKEDVRHFH